MDGYFCVTPSQKIVVLKMASKHSRYDHCYDPQYQQVGGDVTRHVAIEDKSNINNTKQILERVTFTSKGFCHTWF
jgi:hypothetical protein